MTKLSRSDRALLASAWREVTGNPRVRSRKSTRPFRARYPGFCGRCGRAVETSQMIQCHKDFDGVVHIGCQAPEATIHTTRTTRAAATTPPKGPNTVGPRQPRLCPNCHLEHAGECW